MGHSSHGHIKDFVRHVKDFAFYPKENRMSLSNKSEFSEQNGLAIARRSLGDTQEALRRLR